MTQSGIDLVVNNVKLLSFIYNAGINSGQRSNIPMSEYEILRGIPDFSKEELDTAVKNARSKGYINVIHKNGCQFYTCTDSAIKEIEKLQKGRPLHAF